MAEAKKPSFDSFMKTIREETGSCSFSESRYAHPEYWLDTGCYALNRIVSGSTQRGFPGGRLVTITGESQSGKSFFAARAIVSALKKGFTRVFYLDTEGGGLVDMMQQEGVDMSLVEQILVPNAEACNVIILRLLDNIANFQKQVPEARFLIVLDSIGGLRAVKLTNDALSDKASKAKGLEGSIGSKSTDMGTTARAVGDMIVSATIPCLKTHTCLIMLNHTYDNPGELTPSKIKNSSAKKSIYMSRVVVQLTPTYKKADKVYGATDDDTFYAGSEIAAFSVKNAFVRPFFEARILNNFTSGENKYYGLFDVAVGYDLITRESSMYKIPVYSGDKKWYAKDIIFGKESDPIWAKLMPLIDEKSAIDMAFGSMAKDACQIEEEELGGDDHMKLGILAQS